MKVIQTLTFVALLSILIVLCNLRIAFEKLAVELQSPSRITEIVSYNCFDVKSYGKIEMDSDGVTLPPDDEIVAKLRGKRVGGLNEYLQNR